jgi:predicted HicB family RNase H-like nuclease
MSPLLIIKVALTKKTSTIIASHWIQKPENTMEYKGYLGQVTYDAETRTYHGTLFGLKDVVTFHGSSIGKFEIAFKESVDDYIAWCKELNEEPEKPKP